MKNSRSNIFLCIFAICFIFHFNESIASPSIYNVVAFGANPSGSVDSTAAFLRAWRAACGSIASSNVYVPQGRFLIQQTTFEGPCSNQAITFIIDGVLLAPSDYNVIGNADHWISFLHVDGVSVNGGILDGQGTGLWACKRSGGHCPTGTATLKVINSKNVFITGLTSLDSQMFHIVIYGSNNVKLQGTKVRAPGNSPNTDGINIQSSSHVTILNSRISTGDDCISIGPATNSIFIQDVVCGPGHGISIGSLGRSSHEGGVKNVTVSVATFMNTQNGVRIKTWATPCDSFVKGVLFQNITMINVDNTIVIDQNYCPDHNNCPNQPSGVKISDITYQYINGSSTKEVAMKFDCSARNPCTGIKLQDVLLSYENRLPKSSCAYASGSETGQVQPRSCLH